MKAVLLSIKPEYCDLIANGKKTIEVRKNKPKLDTPFKVYIYCTQGDALAYPCLNNPKFAIHRTNNGTLNGRQMTVKERVKSDHFFANGKVIGEFVCNKIDRIAHCGTCNNDIRLRIVDEKICYKELDYAYLDNCKLSYTDIDRYSNGCDVYGWHISNLVIYDKPKELSEFKRFCDGVTGYRGCEYYYEENDESQGHFEMCGCDNSRPLKRPPQSWCYVEEVKSSDNI